MSHNLPVYPTNAIFVRCNESNLDYFRILIMGSSDTPYAYGCFLYDLIFHDNYPTSPPEMKLLTTGGDTLRFNPNLYSNGYVCLSILGTWSGSANETWNPAKSNVL